ncbi:dynein regulatory complex protein 9-like isoform X2 [Leptidea sinapis]|uniref:dynein regulatory complex protein 9-like isoform X2 n=1 Tax=Leptidea sinapis TaxID=189913 RepID=UPI002131AFBA|nr:dynein regulatory complex protein 9-like isoform X2 [Leptidea sinapis]
MWQSSFQQILRFGIRLPHSTACLFCTILEDALAQLKILNECNPGLRLQSTLMDMNLHLNDKYGIKREVLDEVDSIKPNKLHCNEYKLKKLLKDRELIIKVLKGAYIDMSEHGNILVLKEYISEISKTYNDREILILVEGRNRQVKRDLNKQLRQQRNHIKSVLYQTECNIKDLCSRFEDASIYANIRGRYVDGWQRARHEQLEFALKDKEYAPSQNIELHKRKSQQEQQVHTEVELLTNIIINETLEKIEVWVNKYDVDMEQIDLKIQIARNKWLSIQKQRIDMEEQFAKHEEEMRIWVQFKRDREEARLYREKMTNCAIVIQAWWRGLLVRRRLGPYKAKKSKNPKTKA